MDAVLHRRREHVNKLALVLSLVAMAIGVAWLLWILLDVLRFAIPALSPTLFTLDTPAPGSPGGLRNAIIGSVMMVTIATAIGTPLGVLAGIYLAEYGARSWLATATRFVNDILLSAPSIVLGLFVYAVIVARMGSFSGWAGIAALALLMIPVVVRTTENMLLLVPNSLREAAYALGADKWRVIMYVTMRAARAGVITGILLAVARIAGESAPLLFTALSNQFLSLNLSDPMANLPVTIFKFALSPYTDWIALAWAAVFLITIGVLALNIIARVFFREEVKR
jgi:phosphate transport system permease protein